MLKEVQDDLLIIHSLSYKRWRNYTIASSFLSLRYIYIYIYIYMSTRLSMHDDSRFNAFFQSVKEKEHHIIKACVRMEIIIWELAQLLLALSSVKYDSNNIINTQKSQISHFLQPFYQSEKISNIRGCRRFTKTTRRI